MNLEHGWVVQKIFVIKLILLHKTRIISCFLFQEKAIIKRLHIPVLYNGVFCVRLVNPFPVLTYAVNRT